jgi:hypothetical protein
MKLTGGKTEVLGRKICPNATFSTTNPTWIDPGIEPGKFLITPRQLQ